MEGFSSLSCGQTLHSDMKLLAKSIFMYCKADEIYEISNFHNLVHFTQIFNLFFTGLIHNNNMESSLYYLLYQDFYK
jgi:hypothetical protein